MKIIKKWISLLVATVLCLGVSALVTACDDPEESSSAAESSSVESSEPVESSSEESSAPTVNPVDALWESVSVSNGYAVRVTYPNGDAVENVKVQICSSASGQCGLPKRTDTYGIATGITAPAGVPERCHVELNNVPAGYTYDQNIYTSATNYEKIVIVLTPEA